MLVRRRSAKRNLFHFVRARVGVEVKANEPYDDDSKPGKKGQYTLKIYHLETKVPRFIRVRYMGLMRKNMLGESESRFLAQMVAPKGSLQLREEAWNAYPFCRTVLTNPEYMKDNFEVVIQSMHIADRGGSSNVHRVSDDVAKDMEIVHVDISSTQFSANART
jgi:hypothetical protein